MPRLTLFTLPKPFTDPHIAMIQRNALASWRALGSDVEVLVMGDDAGVAEAAEEYGATHLGNAATNDYGTPLLDWAFRQAAAHGSGETLCYLNADILLLEDFLAALPQLPREPNLAIGQRWDCDVEAPIDFAADGRSLAAWARKNGKLDLCRGSDYFTYPRTVDFGMPEFAVGRPGWDNWLIGRALKLGMPLIDMTPSVTVIHQNHDYRHVAQRVGADWDGPEANRNRELAATLDRYMHSPANATRVLTPQGLRRPRSLTHLRAKTEEVVALRPSAAPLRWLIGFVRRVAGSFERKSGAARAQG